MNKLPKRILIIGLGLMGGSYAEALSSKGYEVYGLDTKSSSIEFAKSKGIIVDGNVDVKEEFIRSFDFIIFSLYPDILVSWLEKYGSYIKDGTVLTDVTGIKCPVIEKVTRILDGRDIEFIFAHPMAGREVYGVENEDMNIFKKANYIVTPTLNNKEETIALCEELGKEIGCYNIVRLSPEKHDEMIAYLSQLTHCIAVALMNGRDSENLAPYSGNSFYDLTRIASINENMWASLFIENKDNLLKEMDLFLDQMQKIRLAIADEKEDTLKDMMRLSTSKRAKFHRR